MKKPILLMMPFMALCMLCACDPDDEKPVAPEQPQHNVLVGHKWHRDVEATVYGMTFIDRTDIAITTDDEGALTMDSEVVGYGSSVRTYDIVYRFDEETNKLVLNTPDEYFVESWQLYYNPSDRNLYGWDDSTVVYYLVE